MGRKAGMTTKREYSRHFRIIIKLFYAIKRGANIEVDKLEKEFIKSSDNILVAKELTILKNLIR